MSGSCGTSLHNWSPVASRCTPPSAESDASHLTAQLGVAGRHRHRRRRRRRPSSPSIGSLLERQVTRQRRLTCRRRDVTTTEWRHDGPHAVQRITVICHEAGGVPSRLQECASCQSFRSSLPPPLPVQLGPCIHPPGPSPCITHCNSLQCSPMVYFTHRHMTSHKRHNNQVAYCSAGVLTTRCPAPGPRPSRVRAPRNDNIQTNLGPLSLASGQH